MKIQKASGPLAGRTTLAGIAGAAVAAMLFAVVPQLEGVRPVGYLDPVGIATKCMGDTTDVVVGRVYSDAECLASMERQLVAHADGVLRCTPSLKGHDNQLSAAVLLAYNIGVQRYCASTVARRFNTGEFKGGCAAFTPYNKAGGKVLPGLVHRRAVERALCEKGL